MLCRATLLKAGASRNASASQQELSALLVAADPKAGTVELQLDDGDKEAANLILGTNGSSDAVVLLREEQPAPVCTRFRIVSCTLNCELPAEWSNVGLENMTFAEHAPQSFEWLAISGVTYDS